MEVSLAYPPEVGTCMYRDSSGYDGLYIRCFVVTTRFSFDRALNQFIHTKFTPSSTLSSTESPDIAFVNLELTTNTAILSISFTIANKHGGLVGMQGFQVGEANMREI